MKNLIVFTIDDSFMEPLIVALQSFMEFNDKSKYQFAVIHSNLTDKNIKLIRHYCELNNLEIIFKKIEDIFTHISVKYHFNSVIFYRLLIPCIFNEYKKVLYLDSDILFLDNIDELFNINLEDNILAAIPRSFMGVPEYLKDSTEEYYASGLLLFNINLFIRNNILDKVFYFLKTHEYHWPDQDALNVVVNNWKDIDLRYGVETEFFDSDLPILKKAKNNPAIIQFSGHLKPWKFKNYHPYKKLYWKYLRMTPLRSYIPQDMTAIKVIKWMIPKKLKDIVKNYVKSN